MQNKVKFQQRTTCKLGDETCYNTEANWQKIIRTEDFESNLGEFDVYFCKKCKIGFTDPYPTEETTQYLYESRNSKDFDAIRNTFIDHLKDYLSVKQLKQLTHQMDIKNVLDYSTGNGRFAFSAAKAFPNACVDAVDYHVTPPPLFQTSSELKVNYYTVTEFPTLVHQYDLIILRHVLEHTHHPIELIKELSTHLSPNGIIYIEVPNLESGYAKFFKKYATLYYVPRHLFHYTSDSLKNIVHRAGLEATIGKNEMPLMGNTISVLLGLNRSNILIQCLGILLHPFQLLIEAWHRSSTCIHAICQHKISD